MAVVCNLEKARPKRCTSAYSRKKGQNVETKKNSRSWNKKLVIYNIKWCHMDGTYGHSICAFVIF